MKTIQKAFAAFVFLALSLEWLPAAETADTLVAKALRDTKSVNAAEAKKLVEAGNIVVLDVREPEEYAGEIVPGAVNIPRGMIEFSIPAKVKNKGQAIITYCLKGGRGALAAQTLQTMGYTKVYSIAGGFTAWKAASYPTEKGTK
jgi:rhodanese-related sulfurtransferase